MKASTINAKSVLTEWVLSVLTQVLLKKQNKTKSLLFPLPIAVPSVHSEHSVLPDYNGVLDQGPLPSTLSAFTQLHLSVH